MMKNNFYLLLAVLVTTVFFGCKPKNIDINDALKQISEQTFAKTPSRSYLAVSGNDLRIVEYTFDEAAKTAVRKELNFAQKAAYDGVQAENFTYTWGEFKEGMFGRTILLTGGSGDRSLTYLNDQLNDGDITTAISEPRADMVGNMVDGLTAGKWTGEDPTYVLQLKWVDTTVYEYHRKGKVYVIDTIFKRMPRPNYADTIGVDSCLYYSYIFEKGATSKTAQLITEIKRNEVTAHKQILPQYQDPKKNDTIITYTIEDGVKVPVDVVNYTYWAINDVKIVKDAQDLDVVVGQATGDPVTLAMTDFNYNGSAGSFVLDSKTYLFTPKN